MVYSSRRRHTRCALVTGVQTCALPICRWQVGHEELGCPLWGLSTGRADLSPLAGRLEAIPGCISGTELHRVDAPPWLPEHFVRTPRHSQFDARTGRSPAGVRMADSLGWA